MPGTEAKAKKVAMKAPCGFCGILSLRQGQPRYRGYFSYLSMYNLQRSHLYSSLFRQDLNHFCDLTVPYVIE